jgi:NAD(P)-dependent dehydrogenase (short-subunit alcohol dehydrogenase family)/AcrR family transcriptional regulator
MKKSDLTKSISTHIKNKKLVQKRRDQIILAAVKLFPKKGFVKTTLKDLSEEAGLSYGNIYDYVGNKEDIFLLVHDFLTGLADQGLDKSIENIDDPLQKLKKMIHSEFEISYRWSDGILFVYQDIHILKKPLLRKLLKKESEHVKKFRNVLDECIEKGLFRNCNTRLVANLIKIMVDSWVIKRWDLKGITQFQMENTILKLVLDGLRTEKAGQRRVGETVADFEGKSILVVNGSGVFGNAISSFLLSRGAKLALYVPNEDMTDPFMGSVYSFLEETVRAKVYSFEEYGPLTQQLFMLMQSECGPFDIVIQDVGTSVSGTDKPGEKPTLLNERLMENLNMARNLSGVLRDEFAVRRTGRVLYIAPWAWDKYVDPVLYETTKAGTIALARSNSRIMHEFGITVNCLVPGHIGGIKSLSSHEIDALQDVDSVLMKKTLGEVSDVTKVASFLISDSAKYVTGQVIAVDGGVA